MNNLAKLTPVKELTASLTAIQKHTRLFLIAVILDLLFFLAFGFFTGGIRDKIVEYGILIANKLSAQGAETGLLSHLFTPTIQPLTNTILLLLLTFAIVFYIIYTIFHGSTWWLTTRIAGKKWAYRTYFFRFAKQNLIWVTLFSVLYLVKILFDMRHAIAKTIIPEAINISGHFMTGLIAIAITASLFSYTTLNLKQLFITPLTTSIAIIFFSAILFLATQSILNLIAKINVTTALALGLVMFPLLVYLRIYASRTIYHVRT